jgi:hypothetical protein
LQSIIAESFDRRVSRDSDKLLRFTEAEIILPVK